MFKNKTIKLFLILGVILFSLVGVVGCTNPTGSDNVNATYINTSIEIGEENNQFKVVNNHIDLITLLKNKIPEKYNEDFFKTKSLLVFKIFEESGGNRSKIESYKIIDKTINVYVETKQYGATTDIGIWCFILELGKEEVETFENVKIFKNGEEIMSEKIVKINSLTDTISDYIKNVFLNKINSESKKTISVEDVNILYFLGQYGDNYVALIEGDCMAIPEKTIVIGDLLFEYVRESISVYNKNAYYSLKEAYELNLINYEQLFTIYNVYQEYKSNII